MKSLRLWWDAVQYSMPPPLLALSSPLNLSLHIPPPILYTGSHCFRPKSEKKKASMAWLLRCNPGESQRDVWGCICTSISFCCSRWDFERGDSRWGGGEDGLQGSDESANAIPCLSSTLLMPHCQNFLVVWAPEPSSGFCFAGAYPWPGAGLGARRVWAGGIRNPAPGGPGLQDQSSCSIRASMSGWQVVEGGLRWTWRLDGLAERSSSGAETDGWLTHQSLPSPLPLSPSATGALSVNGVSSAFIAAGSGPDVSTHLQTWCFVKKRSYLGALSNLSRHKHPLAGLREHRLLFWFVGLDWSLRIWISKQHTGAAGAAGLGTRPGEAPI